MNINVSKPSSTYVPFAVTKIVDKETASTAVDVPWGYYLASRQRRILTRVMTTSINSCIGYLFWDKVHCNFLFAHISTDGEACSVVSLVKELTGEIYSDEALFVCVTGMGPSNATTARINHIVSNIGRPHRYFNTPCGGVTVDIALETIIQSKGPVGENVKISKEEKKAAMQKENKLPLYSIELSNSWTGTGKIACPPIVMKTRARSSSLDKTPEY